MQEINIDDDYDVGRIYNDKKVQHNKPRTRYETEVLSQASVDSYFSESVYQITNPKEAARDKFMRHGDGKRKNVKEAKRRAAQERIRKRNLRMQAHPHGKEYARKELSEEQKQLIADEEARQAEREKIPPLVDLNDRNSYARLAAQTMPQSCDDDDEDLLEMLSSVSDKASELSGEASQWISHLENIVIMAWQVAKARSFSDVFVAIIAYIKMNTHKSILNQIMQLIDELTTVCKDDEVEPHAWSGRDIVRNWDLFKTNSIFKRLSYLISAAMSLSICSIKEIEWSPFGLRLISIHAAQEQLRAVDVIDAAINTFVWLAETGYRVFQEKSLRPILYADQEMATFNDDCDWVLANAEQAIAGNLGDITDFEHKVDNVLRTVCEMKQVQPTGPTSLWLQRRYSELVNIKHKIISKHRNTAIRFAPFGVGITGPSGVGKSTLSKIVMKTALHAMDFDVDPKRIITKDMFDKYDSTYTSDILGVFMDDVGNGKSAFAQTSPTDVIIKFFNNMAAQAVKAELNAKGVVFIAFKVGVLTSNFEDYNVNDYTNKPEASLRRFIHTRTHIKEKYRKPGSVSLNTHHPELQGVKLTHDVWELDIEECHIFETAPGRESWIFRPLRVQLGDEEILCQKLDLRTYLRVISALAQRHKVAQAEVMNRSDEFDTAPMCQYCKLPQGVCDCTCPHGLENLGEIIVDSATTAVTSYVQSWFSPLKLYNTLLGFKPIKGMATARLTDELESAIHDTVTPFIITYLPQFLFESPLIVRFVRLWQRSAALYDFKKQLKWVRRCALGVLFYSIYYQDFSTLWKSLLFLFFVTYIKWTHSLARVAYYEQEYMERRDALPVFAKKIRDGYVTKGAFVAATLVVGVKLFRMWNKARLEKIQPTGSLDDMDNQPSWFGFMMKKLNMSVSTDPVMRTSTSDQLMTVFRKKNLFWADFEREDGSRIRCNIFFPRKCVAWFPEHIFFPGCDMTKEPSPILKVTVYRHKDKAGGIFKFVCEHASSVRSNEHDLVCAYVADCPDFKPVLHMLPLTRPKGMGLCQFLVRRQDHHLEERVTVEFGKTGHKYKQFYGGSYTTALSRDGACMGMLISESKTPFIAGFHIGGNTGMNYGVMQTVTLPEAEELIERLSRIPGVELSANAADIPEKQYDKPILQSHEVHPHSMAARLPETAFVDVIGSTKLRAQFKSTVRKSVISDVVEREFGVPNVWGPPKMVPNWRAFNATLEHIVDPSDMFPHSVLERARQDWLEPLIPAMRLYVEKEDFRPLTKHEMVCGVPGKRFLDPVPMSTSMGFPVFGPKSHYFIEERDGESLITREPTEIVEAEVNRLEECWRRGVRAYPVFSATLKDEPTPIDKDKVRVFQAGPVALGLLIRKYYLPVARFLSLHPVLSESAVGVNAFSDQWEELMAHAHKFADDNKVIAWDYSKYDVRMNSQMTRAVLLSFIELAQAGGYSDDDLHIMRNMISDIVHPLIDYNGTLIMAFNMNTSGNNITVNINSCAGSLYVRTGFFHVYPNVRDFRSKVAAMTYGDDFTGSVHPDYREFNFKTYKAFLAKYGMKITLPDKSGDEVSFLNRDTVDFLKRQSQFIPEIGVTIGKLDEKSIFKSLHANLESKTETPLNVSVNCIESAMHEWFAHGRDVYEQRRKCMLRVCDEFGLRLPAVDASFDDRVEHWKTKYRSEALVDT